jgi:hypothetical protein
MSFPIIILIMLLAGVAGGTINYLLPSNINDKKEKIRNIFACVALGIGATILIPLFLEIAQSKLMDNVHFGWALQSDTCDCSKPGSDSLFLKVTVQADTVKKAGNDTGKAGTAKSDIKVASNKNAAAAGKDCCVPIKNYFLFAAYCFLAAAAGFRFINSITDSVLKDKQIADAKEGKAKAEGEKQAIEKENNKRVKNSQISQQQEEKKLRNEMANERIRDVQVKGILDIENLNAIATPVIPVLPPVTHPEDPQKGRFGGKAENNDRKLSANVTASAIPDFYKVVLTVESTNPQNPLNTDVVFYIHDSFSPSIFTYKPEEFTDGKAIEDEILSYGAFTVGVITDNGKTLLELDLAENESFPKQFRER